MTVQPDKREIGFVVLILIIVLIGFFYKSVFLGEVLIPSDNIFYGDKFWESYKPANYLDHSKNGAIIDQTYSFIPWRIYATQSIHKGILPLWDPYNSCGKPFIGNLQSALFDPINLFAILCIPVFQQTLFIAILRLLIAGLGTYLFCRSVGLCKTAGFLSSFSFIFSGFMIPWLGHPHVGVACWLPFLFLFAEKIITKPSFRVFTLFAVTVGLQFLAGHIETSLHILTSVTLFFIFRTFQRYRIFKNIKEIFTLWSSYLIAGILGFLLAGIQLFPFLEYLVHSAQYFDRLKNPNLLTLQNMWSNWNELIFKVGAVMTFLFPGIYRYPNCISSWYPYQSLLLNNFYIGIIPFLLVIFLVFLICSRGRILIKKEHHTMIVFFFFLLILTGGIALQLPLLKIIDYLPVFRYAVNERIGLITCYSGSILAGMGWNIIFNDSKMIILKERLNNYIIAIYKKLAILFIIIVSLTLIFSNNLTFLHPHHITIDRTTIFPTFLLILFFLITLGSIMDKIKLSYVQYSLLGLTIIELFYYGVNINPANLPKDIYPTIEPVKFLEDNLHGERISSLGQIFVPEVNKIFNIQDIRGYDPMRVESYDAWLVKRFNRAVNWGSLILINNTDPFALDLLGVKYLITDTQTPIPDHHGLVLVYQNKALQIYENLTRFPRTFILNNPDLEIQNNGLRRNINILRFENIVSSETTATIKIYEPNLISIQTHSTQSGYLFLSDTYYPGWEAFMDNHPAPIYRAMDTFRAVEVPSGEHRVVFEYRPFSFTLGWIISHLTAITLGIGYVLLKDKYLLTTKNKSNF